MLNLGLRKLSRYIPRYVYMYKREATVCKIKLNSLPNDSYFQKLTKIEFEIINLFTSSKKIFIQMLHFELNKMFDEKSYIIII